MYGGVSANLRCLRGVSGVVWVALGEGLDGVSVLVVSLGGNEGV